MPVYSPCITVGSTALVSGQVALDPESGTKDLVGKGDVTAETEQALKNQLGRRPVEAERREDEDWIRAAIRFKEADQALFVARSLTSWDD